jgi:hypothetical protein
MYTFQEQLAPGTVVRYKSARYAYLVYHWGVVDHPDPYTGELRVIHCDKGSVVRTTTMAEFFPEGGQLEIVYAPKGFAEANRILTRMHSLDGKPYDLFAFNCEHVVTWAVTGVASSPQIRSALLGLGLGAAAFALVKAIQG